jgi:hypothetical protein
MSRLDVVIGSQPRTRVERQTRRLQTRRPPTTVRREARGRCTRRRSAVSQHWRLCRRKAEVTGTAMRAQNTPGRRCSGDRQALSACYTSGRAVLYLALSPLVLSSLPLLLSSLHDPAPHYGRQGRRGAFASFTRGNSPASSGSIPVARRAPELSARSTVDRAITADWPLHSPRWGAGSEAAESCSSR